MNVILKRVDSHSGLCSFFWVMMDMVIAEIVNGNKPYVDMKTTYNSQFHSSRSVNRINVWDLFFEQPFQTYDGLRGSKERIFKYHDLIQRNAGNARLIDQYIRPNKKLVASADDFFRQNLSNKSAGVLIRRTDYTDKHPRGHNVQPDMDTIVQDLGMLISENDIDKIFVVTESESCITELSNIFGGEKIITYQKNRCECKNAFIYNVMDCLSFEQKKQINTEYFISILILLKLQYLLLGRTSATEVYKLLRKDTAIYEKIYDLGVY